MVRTFTSRIATREKTPLLVGLVGPSSSGKTCSALRLATGFQRVTGGEIFVIDTEAGRSTQYADKFRFNHVPFGAPFGPLDYLEAVSYCVGLGATTIVIDSMSHEHEGPGGVLEMHAEEHRRLGGSKKTQMLAWNKPKSERRRFINTLLQVNCNFIFCFRAKEKMKIEQGKDPVPLGFQPIGGDEWMYEMTLNCLLLPRCNGVPTWQSAQVGEQQIMKLPEQFLAIFGDKPQLSELVGETMAKWASGAKSASPMTTAQLVAEYIACSEPSEYRRLEEIRRVSWPAIPADEKKSVKAASDQCSQRLTDAAKAPEASPPQDEQP
jgi:hypothetical protein